MKWYVDTFHQHTEKLTPKYFTRYIKNCVHIRKSSPPSPQPSIDGKIAIQDCGHIVVTSKFFTRIVLIFICGTVIEVAYKNEQGITLIIEELLRCKK